VISILKVRTISMGISKKTAHRYSENIKNLNVKIPWRYFIYVLRRFYGFEIFPSGRTSGSQVALENGDIVFTAHKPHGSGDDIVDRTSRKNAIRALEMLEFLNEEENR
jgi:hypothetical protein